MIYRSIRVNLYSKIQKRNINQYCDLLRLYDGYKRAMNLTSPKMFLSNPMKFQRCACLFNDDISV